MALPISYLSMRYFNVEELESLVDFFNIMTYDLHGPWDQPSLWNRRAPLIGGHANISDIQEGLDLLRRNGIDYNKIVMGFTFLGRGFLLADPTCSEPGTCRFLGASFPSDCTNQAGIVSYQGMPSWCSSLYITVY